MRTVARLVLSPPGWVPAIALMLLPAAAVLLLLSDIRSPFPNVRDNQFEHILLFFVLAFPHGLWQRLPIVWGAVWLAMFGAVIELVQPLAGRGLELGDFLGNLIGIGIGLGSGMALRCALKRV